MSAASRRTALLQSSEHYEAARHALADHGVMVGSVVLDLTRMMARKAEVVSANVKGVEFLFRKNKVTWLKGEGRIIAPGTVRVNGTDYAARHIIIATGSESIPLPGVPVDEKRIVTSTGALELDAVPEAPRRHRRRLHRARARQRSGGASAPR